MSRRYWVCGLRTDWHSCANLSVHLFWYLFLGTHSVEWLWKKCLHLLLSLHFILAHTTSHIPPLFLLLNILVFFFLGGLLLHAQHVLLLLTIFFTSCHTLLFSPGNQTTSGCCTWPPPLLQISFFSLYKKCPSYTYT